MDIIVKKHLSRQEIHSAVHLLFQIADVILLVFILHMAFRITCRADTEIAMLSDLFDKFARIAEAVCIGKCHPRRDIPAQGKDILDAVRL